MDINSKDKRDSTPLHWAAFAGAEISLSYIVAFTQDISPKDAKGLTPLHLAVKSGEDLRSTKSIKLLLLKGADRHALDNHNKRPGELLDDYS